MKLYEFNVIDHTNLPESKILENLKVILEQESDIQGWALGYTVSQVQNPKVLSDGNIKYSFIVEGNLLLDSNFDKNNN